MARANSLRKVVKCTGCERPIVWAQTSNGKSMPVDAVPTKDGNVLLFDTADPGRLFAMVLAKPELEARPEVERFTSHFATCPEAARFRKRGKR